MLIEHKFVGKLIIEMPWTDIFTTWTTHTPSHPARNSPVTRGICQICDPDCTRKNPFEKMFPQNVSVLPKCEISKSKSLTLFSKAASLYYSSSELI